MVIIIAVLLRLICPFFNFEKSFKLKVDRIVLKNVYILFTHIPPLLKCYCIYKLTETESKVMVARGWGGEYGEMLIKGYKLVVIRRISSRDLMYSMVIIVNNTVLYSSKLIRE